MEQKSISSDLIRGHIDTIILHTLLDGDKYAQQISENIETKSDNEYKINQATLYSSLKRLESLRYVSSYWNDSSTGRRKYFKLTESGKNCVENDLSSWSYSREIIDKLMDCAPTPIYKTQIIEKIVEVEKVVEVEKPVSLTENTQQNALEQPVLAQETPKTVQNEQITSENAQDINFRNVLNDLVQSSTLSTKKVQPTELEPLEKVDKIETVEVQKFNETISTTDYNAERSNNNGKIDFGDLSLKAAKEGFKLRISSKYSYVKSGNLLINRLNLISTLSVYLIAILTFLLFSVIFKSQLELSGTITALVITGLSIYPIIEIIKFIKKPNKTITKHITPDSIITSSIIVFNLLLITVALNLILGTDLYQTKTLLISLVFPSLLYVFVIVYYTIRFYLSKSAFVKLKNNKK